MASRLNTKFTAWTGVLTIKAGDQYSDAITRDAFMKTTVQCSEPVLVEISNHPRPDTSDSSTDWYEPSGSAKFVDLYTYPFAWLRVKLASGAATTDTDCYICSIPPSLN